MENELLKKSERDGKIRKQPVGIVQIEVLLKQALLDLEEAGKIAHIAERATYLMAYMAMLKAGRALLLLYGYVPHDGAQHKTVVDITSNVLGEKYRDLVDQFEVMRRKRNVMTYEAGGLLSKSEAQRAFDQSSLLVHAILDRVKLQNPQLNLEFE